MYDVTPWQSYRLSPAVAYYSVLKHFLKTLVGTAIGSTASARVDEIVFAVLELAHCKRQMSSYFLFAPVTLKPPWARNESLTTREL